MAASQSLLVITIPPGRASAARAAEAADRYDALERAIRELEPCELPKTIAVRVEAGRPTCHEWVAAETRPTA
jgi:uncharacterized protein involved in tolerance to divalent cations